MIESECYFERNVAKFAKEQPQIAYLLPYADIGDYTRCFTEQREENLKRGAFFLHSPIGALQEAEQWIGPLYSSTFLCVYGVGLGYGYRAAKGWLDADPKRRLFFLEDDLSVLFYLLHTPIAEQILDDPRVTLRYFKDLSDQKVLDSLCWDSLLEPLTISSLPSYAAHKDYAALQERLSFDRHRLDEAAGEYLDHGIAYFRNFYANLLSLPHSLLGDALFDKFPNTPAIICGAGPSLAKDLERLRAVKDRALIFAGGSAINALQPHMQPHFGAGIDPNREQYERYLSHSAKNLPFFYRQRINKEAFSLLLGPTLYLSGGGGYDVAALFEEKLGITSQDVDEGHNVVNFCVSIAHALGCSPILFVGLDLAFTDKKLYAPGVLQEEPQEIEERLIKLDIHGKPIYTMQKWVAEAKWLSLFAASHPETEFINCTEAGMGIEGVANQPLSAIQLVYREDLEKKISTLLKGATLPSDSEQRVEQSLQELKESLERVITILGSLLEELKRRFEEILKGESVKLSYQSLLELELEEQTAFIYVLSVFDEVYSKSLQRRIREARYLSEKEQQLKKLELQTERYAFLQQTAYVNLELIREALTLHFEEGTRFHYYRDGSLAQIQRRCRGKREGLQEYFYPDQRVKARLFL